MSLPDAAVAFVGHGKDMRRQLTQLVLGVQVHPLRVVQTWDLLVRVDGRQDAADVCLKSAIPDEPGHAVARQTT